MYKDRKRFVEQIQKQLHNGSTTHKGIGLNKIHQVRKELGLPPMTAHMAGGGLFGFKYMLI